MIEMFSSAAAEQTKPKLKLSLKHSVEFFPGPGILSPQKLQAQVAELPAFCAAGWVLFDTDQLKLALAQECRLWKRAFGAALDRRASADMDDIFSFVDGVTKRLQRPIADLEDVRGAMAALREVSQRLIGCQSCLSSFLYWSILSRFTHQLINNLLHLLVPSQIQASISF